MNDILLDANGDMITGSDLATGDATRQNQWMIIVSHKGDWKQHPLTGVGISAWLKDENIAGLKAEIKEQLKADGMKISKLTINQAEISIDATY